MQVTKSVGLDSIGRKIETEPKSRFCVSRGAFQHKVGQIKPNSSKSIRNSVTDRTFSEAEQSFSKVVFRDFRSHGISDRLGAIGEASYERPSVLSPEAMETEVGQHFKNDLGHRKCQNRFNVVEGNTTFSPGRAIMVSDGRNLCYNRCLQNGMGGTLGRPDGPRDLESRGNEDAYKSIGDESGNTCFPEMGSTLEEQVSACSVGQCFSSSVHKSPGGDNFTPSVSICSEVMADGHRESDSVEGSSYSGRSQCLSRPFKQTESQDLSHRMVSEGISSTENLASVLSTSNRSVRISTEPQTASLLLLAEGPTGMGNGQPVNVLGGDPGVCISPNCVDSQNTGPCIQIQLQSTVSCSEVATQTMVHSDPQFVVRHAVINSSSPRPTEDDGNRHISPRSGVFEIGNLANFGSRSRPSGISESAGKLMLAAWRRGTQNVYSSQYRIFRSWCLEREIDPTSASLNEALNFLAFLYESGKQYRTICVYRSMLSNVLSPVDGKNIGEHPSVVRLLKGVFNTRPPKKQLVPEWDLELVLKVLKGTPFEPMRKAPLKLVTYKFVLLLAIVTARRVSDLSHLAIGEFCRIQNSTITFLPTNLAKADDPSHFLKEIVISSFPDKLLDVRRMMMYYLKATEKLRLSSKDPRSLFRCLSKPYNPVSSQTISKWISSAIRLCYEVSEHSDIPSARAHSVRAIAPNWALYKGASKETIMEAADWRNQTSFIRHYLRHLDQYRSQFGKAVLEAGDMVDTNTPSS